MTFFLDLSSLIIQYIYFFFAYKKGSKMLKIKLSIDLFLNS